MQIFLYLYKDYYSEHSPICNYCQHEASLFILSQLPKPYMHSKTIYNSKICHLLNKISITEYEFQNALFHVCPVDSVFLVMNSLLLKRLLLHHPTFHCLMTPWRENDMCPLGRTSHDVTCILLLC